MQLGKTYLNEKELANISESDFANLVKGQDLGGVDRYEAWKKFSKLAEPFKIKKQLKPIQKNEEFI